MQTELSNNELIPGDVPSFREPWARILPFAMTFDGYRHWGSIETCAKIASRTPCTLTELRTCLFFEARRWFIRGSEPDVAAMRRVRALLRVIQQKVASGDLR